jgi:hypothetical protein
VLVILLVVAGLVAANWSKLTGYYQQAKSTFSDMMTVRAALQKKYAVDVRITAKSVSGVQGAILNVTLVNAPVMDRINIDGPDGRQTAPDVAAAARDILPPGRGYDHYEVAFLRERGALGVSMSRFGISLHSCRAVAGETAIGTDWRESTLTATSPTAPAASRCSATVRP